MPDYFYSVDISRDKRLARTPNYVDKFLVELVCEDHRNEKLAEFDREIAASELATDASKKRYGLAGTENVGFRQASQYGGTIPANFGEPQFKALCGCRVWYL